MSTPGRPYIWKMVREAIDAIGPNTTNKALRAWVLEHYPGTNPSSISCCFVSCSVNLPSRIHYASNQKPRKCDTQHDFLFWSGRGKLESYDPDQHGRWEISERDDGSLVVRPQDHGGETSGDTAGIEGGAMSDGNAFAAENHLRDYLVEHIDDIESGLEIYVDDEGTIGVEFVIPAGRIDILAVDRQGAFVVIELKVGRGPDAVAAQLLWYMGWMRRHMAEGKLVRGIIIAQRISDRIRYALDGQDNIQLKEYELSLDLRDADPLP